MGAPTTLTTAARVGDVSLTRVALVRPGSELHNRLYRDFHDIGCKPIWGIYEFDRSMHPAHELRFGDGSWTELDDSELTDVILLTDMGEAALSELFP